LAFHEFSADLLQQYLGDISRGKASGRIFFLHTMLPHFPYVFEDDGDYAVDELREFPRDPLQPLANDDFEIIWSQYREQIRYADRFLGELIAKLESEGLYDRATIVLTADHGARPVFPLNGEQIEVTSLSTGVPMFIRTPGVTPAKTDVEYQHIDFGPTLYELLGRDYDYGTDTPIGSNVGVSAMDTVRPERERNFIVHFEQTRYWRYEFDEATTSWPLAEIVDGPVGDRTLSPPLMGTTRSP
jgi:arylsulfatase A-like enzyme